MANSYDAVIKLLEPVDVGTNSTIDVLQTADSYEVLADVEVGENLAAFGPDFVLRVAIINLTTSAQVALNHITGTISVAANTTFTADLRVPFGPISGSVTDDVLQAVATFRVYSGTIEDVSSALSDTFVVGK
jgi:hypothetical protein